MDPILIFIKNNVQAVLDRMVLHTKQDKGQIPFTSAGDNIILGKQGKFCSMHNPVLQSPEHLNVKVQLILL